jgi:S1-C subfamily serine protease
MLSPRFPMEFLPLCFPVRARLALALFAAIFGGTSSGFAQAPAAPPPAPVAPAPAVSALVENSVVKVFSTMRLPDPYRPWTKQAPADESGTGVVIEGQRILTNAHVVLYATQIQIQANQSGDKIFATVESISPGIDLAVLKLDDETFFDTHPPLPRASTLPSVKDSVLVYGFPTGGTSLSITKGIVSRIEFAGYNYPVSGLRIQIDAAINPGNSGGPAVAGDTMIGLAFSRLGGGAENIGYIIPSEEIELFLRGIQGGRTYAKPMLFDELQTLQNPGLRNFLKLDPAMKGLVVSKPDRTDPAYPLRKWDVITRIGDTPIDDEGMIRITGSLRVGFQYLLQKLARAGTVKLTVIRGGKLVTLAMPVATSRTLLIPDLRGTYPSYFVCGPLVFSTATAQFFAGIGGNAGALASLSFLGSPLLTRRGDPPAFLGESLVVVSSPFFPHKLAEGYDSPQVNVLASVNGIPIQNLEHLVAVLRDSREEFLRFEFAGRSREVLIFPRKELMTATDDILGDNGVRSQGSPDTLAIWNAKPAPP